MDDQATPYDDIRAEGVHVRVDRRLRVVALRYLDRTGAFAQQCHVLFGVALPDVQCAVGVTAAAPEQECILGWRNPQQTVALLSNGGTFAASTLRLPPTDDGCCVDQSGGVWVLRLTGKGVEDLLLRIGNNASVPRPGEAHVSRIADMAVMSLCVTAGETLLVVDRAYAEHLLNWIRVTAFAESMQ